MVWWSRIAMQTPFVYPIRFPTRTRKSYFPLLDGLRFISITAVIWHHTAGNIYTGILWRGSEGVSPFFVISGFLITTILLRERSSTGAISAKRFYLRRVLRIFPAYYAILALYVVLVIVFERDSAEGNQFWRNLYQTGLYLLRPPA